MDKYENVQKKCLKWVLFKEAMSYNSEGIYIYRNVNK